jgi:hypothetical protein
LAKFANIGYNEETGLILKDFAGDVGQIEVDPEEADWTAIDAIYAVLDELYNKQDELGQKIDGVQAKQAAAKAKAKAKKELQA